MSATPALFDPLANVYDRRRPRYPDELIGRLPQLVQMRRQPLVIFDAGAGTGIALGQIIHAFGPACRYIAADISANMIEIGRQRWPAADWRLGPVENLLCDLTGIGLIVCAQSLQWFDRPRFYAAAGEALDAGGCLAALQNNREWQVSAFLDRYEQLLEELSPGYSRHYRSFDVAREFAALSWVSTPPVTECRRWTRSMTVDEFTEMSHSSTRVQAALKAYPEEFGQRLSSLCTAYAHAGIIDVPYVTELFVAIKRPG